MWLEKMKDDVQSILSLIAHREYPDEKHRERYIESYEVRPILASDLGKDHWIWIENKVAIVLSRDIILYGIHSNLLLEVAFRTGWPAGNKVAILSTGQPLYFPYNWRKNETLYVDWKLMDGSRKRNVAFSILGFVVEPKGCTVTV